MLNSFLFTAIDKNNKQVTDRVSAENIGAAKYKLEIQGFTAIEFHSSELSNDVSNMFTDMQIKLFENVKAEKVVQAQFEKVYWGIPSNFLKTIIISASITFALSIWLQSSFLFYFVSILIILTTYFVTPVVIYHHFITAHFWANNSGVRFWAKITKTFNLITFNKIPAFSIDQYLACADAREGMIEKGLERLSKYQNSPKVSKRLYNNALAGLYLAAKKYDEVRKIREESLHEGNMFPEEMIDYAVGMTLHHQRTDVSRSVIEKVLDMETSVLSMIYIPFCQGVIEVEDKNYLMGEFYLKEAEKRLQPYQNNSNFDGIKSMIKTFLAITLGEKGEKDTSKQLFEEAKPYLVAQKEFKLIERCEESSS